MITYDEKLVVEELNKRKGQKVWYRGSWGYDKPELGIFTGAEYSEDKNDIIVGVGCEDGHSHWGYLDQIEFVEK